MLTIVILHSVSCGPVYAVALHRALSSYQEGVSDLEVVSIAAAWKDSWDLRGWWQA